MAKATTIKEALKKLEETRGVVAAELEKVCVCRAAKAVCCECVFDRQRAASTQHSPAGWMDHAVAAAVLIDGGVVLMQVELYGQCPPIEKMDATLSTLKACKCALACPLSLHPSCIVHVAQVVHRPAAPGCSRGLCVNHKGMVLRRTTCPA